MLVGEFPVKSSYALKLLLSSRFILWERKRDRDRMRFLRQLIYCVGRRYLTAVYCLGPAAILFAADPAPRVTKVVHSEVRMATTVRSSVVSPKLVVERPVTEAVVASRLVPLNPPSPAKETDEPSGIDQTVARIAAQHQISPDLIHSVIKVESNYNPYAISPKGALGLMQLIPSTARRFGVLDVFNPMENIQGGVKYLKYLLNLFGGDYRLALAAYNAGEAAVTRYSGVPPFPETQNYLRRVLKQWSVQRSMSVTAIRR